MLSFAALSETAIAESTTTLDASAFMSGAAANASAGTLEYDAKAKITTTSASAIFTSSAFGDLDAQANIEILSVTATVSAGSVHTNVNEDLESVSATASAGVLLYDAKAHVTPSAATATTTAGTLWYNAKATTPALTGVYLNILYHDFLDEDAQASTTLTGVSGTGIADWDTVNGINAVNVIFLNTDFERSRTVNIVPYGNYKVYITR